MALCEGTDALGAALVDRGGETVDYAGYLDPFNMKVAAAEWRLVLELVRDVPHPSYQETRGILIRGRKKSFAVVGISTGYAIVLALPRRSLRAFRAGRRRGRARRRARGAARYR